MINQTDNIIQNHYHQTMRLPDGRTLGYAEYGDRHGFPLFHFHGGNSSRLEGQWLAEAAAAHHIRLLAPDRPGFGLSDPHPQRTFLSWSVDIAHVADALGIDRFAVMGLSGAVSHCARSCRCRASCSSDSGESKMRGRLALTKGPGRRKSPRSQRRGSFALLLFRATLPNEGSGGWEDLTAASSFRFASSSAESEGDFASICLISRVSA